MKKIIAIIILVAFIGAVAFASLRTNRTEKKQVQTEKNEKKTEQKKECKRPCPFS